MDAPSDPATRSTAGSSQRPLAILLGIAAVTRLVYLAQYAQLPIIDGPAFDSLAYLRQAAAIHQGRFGDPSLIAFSPLYGYFLALLGDPPNLLRAITIQQVLGCFNLVLIYVLSERLVGRLAAIATGALYLSYGLLAFYETKILAETLGLTLLLSTCVLMTRQTVARGGLRACIGAGSVLALAVLARSNLLICLPFVGVATLLAWRTPDETLRSRWQRAIGIGLGVALVFGANGLWNMRNTGLFVPVILRSATVSRSTHVRWDGKLSQFSNRDDRQVGVFDVIDQASARIRGQAPPAPEPDFDFAGLLRDAPRRLAGTFSNTETDFQYGYYGERSELPALRLLSGSFGVLLVLGLLGAAVTLGQGAWHRLIVLAPWALGAVATTLLTHPSSRYRLPIVVPLLVLAGAAVAWLIETRHTRRGQLMIALAVLPSLYFAHATWSYELADPAMWHLRLAESALTAADVEEGQRRIDQATQLAGSEPHIRQRVAYLRHRFMGGPAPSP